jgi:hypothetical protein
VHAPRVQHLVPSPNAFREFPNMKKFPARAPETAREARALPRVRLRHLPGIEKLALIVDVLCNR